MKEGINETHGSEILSEGHAYIENQNEMVEWLQRYEDYLYEEGSPSSVFPCALEAMLNNDPLPEAISESDDAWVNRDYIEQAARPIFDEYKDNIGPVIKAAKIVHPKAQTIPHPGK